MRRPALLSLISLTLFACAPSDAERLADERAAIEEALMRLNDAENSLGSLGVEEVIRRIDGVLSPDWAGGVGGASEHSRAEEREFERGLFSGMPDYHRTFDILVIEPPHAAVLWTITGTHTGELLGVPASGRPVKVRGMSLFEFESGRVRRS